MDLTKEIENISKQIIDLAGKNNMAIKEISWLLTQIHEKVYERAIIKTTD